MLKVIATDDQGNTHVYTSDDILEDVHEVQSLFTLCTCCGDVMLHAHTNTDGHCIRCSKIAMDNMQKK